MANPDHVAVLRKGRDFWNRWRKENPDIKPDLKHFGVDRNIDYSGCFCEVETDFSKYDLRDVELSHSVILRPNFFGADLRGADLSHASFVSANLKEANLSKAYFIEASLPFSDFGGQNLTEVLLGSAVLNNSDFSRANLSGVYLRGTNFSSSNLTAADLSNTDLTAANLNDANCENANLTAANLEYASLVSTNFAYAALTECRIFGISAWDLKLENTIQANLVVTKSDEPTITVDNIEVAQFIYLMLNNRKIRNIIDTITSKVVLILGSFKNERKKVLDALRDQLRYRDFTPVLFDFAKPSSRDLTETISTLAHMACFVIADLTDAKSIPQELQKIIPNLPSLPVRPIILENQFEYAMFKDFGAYLSVLPPYRYQNTDHLLDTLVDKVVDPAMHKAQEIHERRKAFEQELEN